MSEHFDTPILLLIFNRPHTTQQVFNRIKIIKPRYLYVAADGPRPGNEDDLNKCDETRNIINQINWECEIKTLFRTNNMGCGKAVSTAITWFFSHAEEGIILEDDCFPDLSFFYYCKELLLKYKNEAHVMHIGGNNFQNGIVRGTGSYYFSNYNHIWGWATWKRAWDKYDFKMKDFYEIFNSKGLDHVFQSNSEKKYWTNIFVKTFEMKTNTWDYQWTYAIWKNKGFSISPNVNLVINLGLKNDSSHTFLKDSFKNNLKLCAIKFPLKHVSLNVDIEADTFTYNNNYSHSMRRLFRILKENDLSSILQHVIRRNL